MFPLAVISFLFKSSETNFNLEENPSTEATEEPIKENIEVTVRVRVNGEVKILPIEEYIIGVVAGEMPASFDIEALKAQAVASRTYAIYKRQANKTQEYDLTDDVNTQVYITEDTMHKLWGNDYQKYYEKIVEAVEETKGEIILYDGEAIEAFYFAMSGGSTQGSQSVFQEDKEYLKSVESIYDNDSLKDFLVTLEFTHDDIIKKLSLNCQKVKIDDISKNDAGYVEEITVCGKKIKGTAFRSSLELRSTNLDIDMGSTIKITTRGYGHGVGMSQYGANGYALRGYTYEDILKHYYTGIEIKNMNDV